MPARFFTAVWCFLSQLSLPIWQVYCVRELYGNAEKPPEGENC